MEFPPITELSAVVAPSGAKMENRHILVCMDSEDEVLEMIAKIHLAGCNLVNILDFSPEKKPHAIILGSSYEKALELFLKWDAPVIFYGSAPQTENIYSYGISGVIDSSDPDILLKAIDDALNSFPMVKEIVKLSSKLKQLIDEKNNDSSNLVSSAVQIDKILENVVDVIFITNAQGVSTYISPSCEKVFGFSSDYMAGKPFIEFLREDQIPIAMAEFTDAIVNGKKVINFPLIMKKGENDYFHGELSSSVIIENGMVSGTVGQIRDVSSRIETENRLKESEKKYRDYIENSPHGVFVTDKTGHFLDVNPAAEKSTGYTKEELLQMDIPSIMNPEKAQLGKEHFMRLLMDGFSEGEVAYLHKSGQNRWWFVSATKIDDSTFLGFTIDTTDTHVANEELNKSEERFNSMFEHMSSGAAVYRVVDNGEDFIFLAFNKKAEEMTRIKRADALGRRFFHLFPNMDRTALPAALRRVWQTGVPERLPPFYYKDATRDGWRENRIFRLPSGDVVALFDDVTERKNAENALQEAEEKYRYLINYSQSIIFALSPEGVIFFVSPSWKKHLGADPGGVYGRDLYTMLTPDSAENVKNFLSRTAEGNTFDEGVEYCIFDNDKNVRVHHSVFSPVFDENSRLKMFVGNAIDITKEVELNEEIKDREKRESEQRLAITSIMLDTDLTDSSLDDSLHKILEIVYTTLDLFRVSIWRRSDNGPDMKCIAAIELGEIAVVEDLYLRRSDYPIYFKALEDEGRIYVSDALSDPRTLELADTYLKPFGVQSLMDCGIMLEGKLHGIICCEHAISKRKWFSDEESFVSTMASFISQLFIYEMRRASVLEKDRLETQLQQAMKMEAVGRLAGGIAHDFNNLLTSIVGNVELARMDLLPEHPVSELVEEIGKAAESAASLTRQLLAFSRKQLIEPRIININELLGSLHRMLVRIIGEDVELTTIQRQYDLNVKIDPGQFEQILVNLAVNARDAMPAGGKLIIETARVDLDPEYVNTHPDSNAGRHIMVAVSDTGTGMSDEVKKHLFEPFYTTKPQGRGTGLGLATIYGAVKQAGGSVEVYSEIGKGTTFKIYLPSVKDDIDDIPEKEERPALIGGNETILTVEDDLSVRDMAIKTLTRLGYVVLSAGDGFEAIKKSRDFDGQIHLLLTDVVMPGMNGRQLADILVIERPAMKVLYTSGYTENAIAHHGVIEEGINFIVKPYTPQLVAGKIRSVLEG